MPAALHVMSIKFLLPVFLVGFSQVAIGREVIVCTPVELSYNPASSELTIFTEDSVTSSDAGVLCNNTGSWCKDVSVKPEVETKVYAAKSSISNTMIFFQTNENSQRKYGGCEWQINM